MDAVLRRRLEMAVRVRDFLRAHHTDGMPEGTVLAHLEELVQRADALATQQRDGVVVVRAATEHRLGVRRTLQSNLLRCLAAVGAAAAKENVELGAQFRLPSARATNQAFLTMARGMLEQATAQKALLVSRGMAEKLLDDLARGLAEFETTLEVTRAGRLEHVGASADLQSVAREIGEQVRLLDGLVRYRFGNNAEMMGAWLSARNVLGPFKSHAEDKPAGSEAPGRWRRWRDDGRRIGGQAGSWFNGGARWVEGHLPRLVAFGHRPRKRLGYRPGGMLCALRLSVALQS
jgi:hypothetical protein